MDSDGSHASQIERELQKSEARLQSVLDSAYSAYVSMDEAGLVTDWNRRAIALFGYSRDEAIGRSVAELVIPPRYRDAHWEGLRQFLATGESAVFNQRLELAAINRAGLEFPIELTIWPLRLEDRWTFHALVSDATALREAQRRAMSSERQAAVGQIITFLTQETRNPLQRIQMWSEMLALELKKSPVCLKAVKEIQEAQACLERLLTDVRGYAAPLRLAPKVINMRDTWREAWRQVMQAQGQRQVKLLEELNDVDPCCLADAQAMIQLFYHLLNNAVQRVDGADEIRIACADCSLNDRPAVSISICDYIAPSSIEDSQQIELESTSKQSARGEIEPTELSMAIVARIIEAHGGRINTVQPDSANGELQIVVPRCAAATGG